MDTAMIELVDTHVHVVSSDEERYPLNRFDHPGSEWVDRAPDIDAFGVDLDRAGVAEAVLVQPHGAYRDDNRYVCAAASTADTLAAVGIISGTQSPADAAAGVSGLANAGATGLRLFSIPTPDDSWIDGQVGQAMRNAAGAAGLTVGVCVLPPELAAIGRCAEQEPNQVLVLDHCGFALDEGEDGAAVSALRALEHHPNVVMKVTTHVIDSWRSSGGEVGALMPTLAEWFGIDRLVWGSDYAQTHDRSYPELAALARRTLEPLGADAETLAATARRLWLRPGSN